MKNKPSIFFKLTKVDEAQRLVSGLATAEVPDKTNEVCDYASTKPYYQKWSDGFRKATDGKSLGNLRAMHDKIAAGKIVDILFHDDAKAIEITAKVVDDDCWNKVIEGVFTGFSQGGEYVKRWKDGELTRYTAEPSEVSLVDNPCLGVSIFQVIKADGTQEMRKFIATKETTMPVQKWTTTDGKTFEKKIDALQHQGKIDADEFAKSVLGRVQETVYEIDATLGKREFTDEKRKELAANGHAMEDGSFPIENKTDLENAVHAYGRAKDKEKAKAHIISRAKDLDAMDMIPTDWEGSTKKEETEHEKVKKLLKNETWDAAQAIDALCSIEWLLMSEMCEQEEGSEEAGQVADLQTVVARLKSFIASEIQEGMREDGSLAMAARGGLTKAEHSEHVKEIHKAASHIMSCCMKAMSAEDPEEAEKFMKAAGAESMDHLHTIHKKAQGICERCMKMGSDFTPEDGEDNETHEKMFKAVMNKSVLERDALTKAVAPLQEMVEGLQKRLKILEDQPAPRKGVTMVVKNHHENQSGHEPKETGQAVETASISTAGMSPGDIRGIFNR